MREDERVEPCLLCDAERLTDWQKLACALAARHKAKVALIDFDMQFGDCALLLDTTPQNNVGDALRQADRIDAVLLKTMMTEHAGGVHLLASPARAAVGPPLPALSFP